MSAAVVVYTCDVGGVDWLHRPQMQTPGARFVRFSDRPSFRQSPWEHRPLPPLPAGLSPRLKSRFPKILPHRVLPDAEVTIWIDASVMVLADLTPLVEEFRQSGAALALFRHPTGRSVNAEIDAVLARGFLDGEKHADALRDRYGRVGNLDTPISENTILFRRAGAPGLDAAMENWWHEVTTECQRDQISLPSALDAHGVSVHYWGWHFDEAGSPWFRRIPHRHADPVRRTLTGIHFLSEYRLDYRLLRVPVRAVGTARRWLSRASMHRRVIGSPEQVAPAPETRAASPPVGASSNGPTETSGAPPRDRP